MRSRVVLAQNLLATLRDREVAAAVARLETTTHLSYRPALDGVRVSGIYRETIQLTSGRFAMLDDGVGFSLVPWRPVIEKRLGQQISAVVVMPSPTLRESSREIAKSCRSNSGLHRWQTQEQKFVA